MSVNEYRLTPITTGDIFGIRKTTRRQKTTKKSTKKKEIKRRTFKIDRKELLLKQNELCAYKKCPELHVGHKRQKVTVDSHLDHKTSIKLWELKGNKGNPNAMSNLQLLCPTCHSHKTSEDRKKIAKCKEKHGIKTTKSGRKTTKGKTRMVTVTNILGRKQRVSISKTKLITNIYGEKVRVPKEPWE